MATISRRDFIVGAAALAGMGGAAARAAEPDGEPLEPLGLPIGSQIYPHRPMLSDFPAYVGKLREIGVTRLELCSPIGYGAAFASLTDPREVRKILADHGMKAESSHFTMRELRNSQEKSIEWAREVGVTQMLTATLGGGSNPTLDQVKMAAEEYNRIAAVAAKAGMQQGLHNEGFELSMVDGKRTYDLLFELLDPQLVRFQFQMSTVTAGFVAADYFQKYPGRFISMHLQDIDLRGADQPPAKAQEGPRRRRPQVALGKGSIDWVKTFRAARVGGVKNYFVEQNWELTQASVAYLKTLKV